MNRNLNAFDLQEKQTAERLWMNYYNQALYEEGMITEAERNRMKNKIDSRSRPSERNERFR